MFPGGVGTAEEILYLLGILLEPGERRPAAPVVLTGPQIDRRLLRADRPLHRRNAGQKAAELLHVIVDDPAEVARDMVARHGAGARLPPQQQRLVQLQLAAARSRRPFQQPFEVDARSHGALRLHRDQPAHELAADLRRAFSGIVAGNVKEDGMRAIEKLGPFELTGDASVMKLLDELLTAFVAQKRMKLPGSAYRPCYRLACA